MGARKIRSLVPHIINIWLILLALCVGLCVLAFYFNAALSAERHITSIEKASLGQAMKIEMNADALTYSAHLFAITGQPEFYQNYWVKVNDINNKNNLATNLQELNLPAKEQKLLISANKNIDLLIDTQARSMRLILLSMGVSTNNKMHPSLAPYGHLSADELRLTPVEKINLAQKILFDKAFFKVMATVTDPVKKFREKIQMRIAKESQKAQAQVDRILMVLFAMIVLIAILLLSVIWLRYAFQSKDDDKPVRKS